MAAMKHRLTRVRALTLDDETISILRDCAEVARREGLPCHGGRWSVSAACRMIVRGWHARIIAEAVELAGGAADAAAPAVSVEEEP